MLGISVYFQDLDYEYLEKAALRGAKVIFTSLHIPEEDYSNIGSILPTFLDKCKSLNMDLVPDISPRTFEKLNVPLNDFKKLKDLGLNALRIDNTIEDFDLLKTLAKDFKLYLNASTTSDHYLTAAKAAGVDFSNISVMHNFYPKERTGISPSFFDSLNEVFKKHHLSILTFVPGDDLKRFPLYQGLPTLEKHRDINPYVGAVELMHSFGINDILIGDSKANLYTLEFINEYMVSKTMSIPAFFYPKYEHLFKDFKVRPDLAADVVRLSVPRIPNIEVSNNNQGVRGSITIENRLAGRYSGEMQITKSSMPMNDCTNLVGFIHPDYLQLLNYIDRDTTIRFVPL